MYPKKISKIFCDANGQFAKLVEHFEMFDRRLFGTREAKENLFYLQVNVEFIEQPPRCDVFGKSVGDDESSSADRSITASSQKACFGFVYTPKDIIADSSSGGGSGAGSRAPSPSFRSGLKPPLHSQSPGSGRGISFYNARILPLLHFSMGYRWWFGCSYAESNW